jgi:hypothetical protein
MKTIAISAPYHFCDKVIFNETLDSIVSDNIDVRFTAAAIGSVSELIRAYAEKYFWEYYFYLNDWSTQLNADQKRDQKMIEDADEIILFDDACTEKINVLKQWANIKNIPIHVIEIPKIDTDKYTQIMSKNLNDLQDKNEIYEAIEAFEYAKESAIREGQFEMAARMRDKLRMLSAR